MNEQTNDTQAGEDEPAMGTVNELDVLKQRARMMGVEFSNNIGVETLRERIRAKAEEQSNATAALAPALFDPALIPAATQQASFQADTSGGPALGFEPKPAKPLTLRQYLQREHMKLIRVRITNLDPKKKNLPGEVFTVANEFLGTVRKYIPYGEVSDDGYHVPYCIYRELESRRFLDIRTYKERANNNKIRVEQRWAKEFAIEVLPHLTPTELKQLAVAQMAEVGDTTTLL